MHSKLWPATPTNYTSQETRYRWQDNINNDVAENSVAVKTVLKF